MGAKRRYTNEEIRYIDEHRDDMTAAEIAEHLGRGEKGIRDRLYKTKVRRKEVYRGCDLNCFECKYSECRAPSSVCLKGLDDVL